MILRYLSITESNRESGAKPFSSRLRQNREKGNDQLHPHNLWHLWMIISKVVLKSKFLSSSRFNRKGPLGLASVEIQMVIINNDRDKVYEERFQQRGLLGAWSRKLGVSDQGREGMRRYFTIWSSIVKSRNRVCQSQMTPIVFLTLMFILPYWSLQLGLLWKSKTKSLWLTLSEY